MVSSLSKAINSVDLLTIGILNSDSFSSFVESSGLPRPIIETNTNMMNTKITLD